MSTKTSVGTANQAGSKRTLVVEQGLPAVARVPVAMLQFVAFALTARAAGDVAFGLLVFTQTAVRLTTASAIRGGAPVMLATFASMPSDVAIGELRREIRSSARWATPLWIALVVVMVLVFELDASRGAQLAVILFAIVNAAVVLRLLAEAAKGAGAPIQSILGEFAPLPMVIFAFLATGQFDASGSVPLLEVLSALLLSQLVGCVLLRLQLNRKTTPSAQQIPAQPVRTRRLHLSISTTATLALPLAALAVTAFLGDSESVGRLGAVLRILAPAAILISGIAAGVLPRIVRAHKAAHRAASEDRSLTISWLLVAATSVPYSIILIAAPSLVELIYGSEFADLATAMRIVAFGQLINGLTGVAVEVLQVTGRAKRDTSALIFAGIAALVALGTTVLLDLAPEISGAVFFTAILAARSLIAGVRVYGPVLRQQPVITLPNRENAL